ncbi:MAG: PEP-CTERM sorting domain-containing protein [Verrucomicrobia bacterium]|nr:PEP-CTERM sorting domain-containing protein [Verrucomicrobiota bacterium]
MKKILLLGAVLAAALSAQATLVISYDSGVINQTVVDGSASGVALSQTYSGLFNGDANLGINDVSVNLNITGGYNGDLYGYLVLQSADGFTMTSILLNRVGRTDATGYGSSQSGFGSITLSAAGSPNIHDVVGDPAGGTYLADGRTTNPNGDFTGSSSTAGLDVFNNHNANGTWTLFLADMATGDQSTLVKNVSVVPEPATWALAVFGIGFMVMGLTRRLRREKVGTAAH